MAIQWFPGHMVSARKKAEETMAQVDVIIEVLDARLPGASTNPMIEVLRKARARPCLKVLNKSDLADPKATEAWLCFYNAQAGVKAIALSCKNAKEVAKIPALCQAIVPHRNDNTKPVRMMIMGIPNVGKSTLMNALLKRKIAKVGDEPAVTKSQQFHPIHTRAHLIDTPGLMWPKIEKESDGFLLAASHAIGRNAVPEEEVAAFLGTLLLARYPQFLEARYGVKELEDGFALLEHICHKRALRIKGGGIDLEKAALALLQDYREGKLGRVSLETPESRQAMLIAENESLIIAAP